MNRTASGLLAAALLMIAPAATAAERIVLIEDFSNGG